MTNNTESIENTSITISLKMLWAFVASLLIGSFSLAGFYIGFIGKFSDLQTQVTTNKTTQTGKDQVQDLTMENIKLNVQKIEIDLKEYRKQLESKKDK